MRCEVLSLPFKGLPSLHAALESFVAGEKLTGDNAYFCEICGRKVRREEGALGFGAVAHARRA